MKNAKPMTKKRFNNLYGMWRGYWNKRYEDTPGIKLGTYIALTNASSDIQDKFIEININKDKNGTM